MNKFRKFLHDLAHPPVNRPLTEAERMDHLPQNEPSPIPVAWPQMGVVRMNSTFVEFADRAFLRKGIFSFGMAVAVSALSYYAIVFISYIIRDWNPAGDDFIAMLLSGSFIVFGCLVLLYFFVPLLLLESFNYTHYPIIFNRKTRMVYAFVQLQKGRIFSAPWDEIFFSTTWEGQGADFCVEGHKLAEDRDTVLDTFAMPIHSEHDSEYRFLQWEFIRQYMDGDDQKVAELARMVVEAAGVNGRRETLSESFRQAWAAFAGRNLHFAVISSPLILMATIGRQFAMWTSKLPRWPAEIMDTCQFSPDDPNIRDSEHLAPRRGAPIPDVRPYAGK